MHGTAAAPALGQGCEVSLGCVELQPTLACGGDTVSRGKGGHVAKQVNQAGLRQTAAVCSQSTEEGNSPCPFCTANEGGRPLLEDGSSAPQTSRL